MCAIYASNIDLTKYGGSGRTVCRFADFVEGDVRARSVTRPTYLGSGCVRCVKCACACVCVCARVCVRLYKCDRLRSSAERCVTEIELRT